MSGEPEEEFAERWRRFVEHYRRQRAPEELRQCVIAAARAGAWAELLGPGDDDDLVPPPRAREDSA